MRRFLLGFAVVVLAIAGGLSYLANSNPDGLDTVAQLGCDATGSGACIARDAAAHPLAGTPLADYTLAGDERFTGVAGVLGALVVLALAGGFFWPLRRRGQPAAGR
jgi:cobalt/nickel transport protein